MAAKGERKHGFGKARKLFSRLPRKAPSTKASQVSPMAVIVRVLIVGAMLFFAILSCIFVNNIIGYLPIVVVVFGILLSLVYVRIVGTMVEIDDRSVPHDCKRGDSIDFALAFVNRSILPVSKLRTSFALTNIFGAIDSSMVTDLAVAPKESLNYRFGVDFNHIGEYQVLLEWVRVYDPFGLFWRTHDLSKSYSINVTPHVFPIKKFEEFSVNEATSESTFKPIVTDDMDYAGVRDYVPGDPIKSIHWKLSARSDHYYTRLFEAFGVPGVLIMLDFSSPEYEAEEAMCAFDSIIESAFSVWNYARENGMDAEVAFCDRDGLEVHHSALLAANVVEVIARMPNLSATIKQEKAVELMRSVSSAQHSSDNIVYCTGNLTQALVYTLIELKSRNKMPILILSVPRSADKDVRESMVKMFRRLEMAAIPIFLIDQAQDLNVGGTI